MEVEIVNPAEVPGWDEAVVGIDGYSCFHASAWARVLSDSFGYRPLYFTLKERGELRALLPLMEVRSLATGRRGVSLAFTDYLEPIAADQASFLALLQVAIAHGGKAGWKYLELRGGRGFLPEAPPSARYLGHRLSLDGDEDGLLARLRGNTRWTIRRAAGRGVEVRFDSSLEAVRDFYRLHCMTRKRHGVPPQPFDFFRNIHEHMLQQDRGQVVLASHEGKEIAAAVCFHLGRKALYKYAASDPRYRQLGANDLVLWEAIRSYLKGGYREFCFGRTDPANEGLRRFKAGWATTESDLHYFRYDLRAGSFLAGEGGEPSRYPDLLGRLPESVLGIIGRLLYRHMG